MAVTGEFIADFNNFVIGAKQAEKALESMESQGTRMGASLDKSFKGVDIQSAFTSPLQTAQGVATDFIGGIGSWGTVALGAAAGIGAVGTALIAMGTATAKTADDIGDLSDKTGISVEQLSRLKNAAGLAGTTVDALADVSFKLQQRMAQNPKEFLQGLEALNINAKEFARLDTVGQLEAISRALAEQEDPQQRIIAGTAVMGKAYKDMAPALMELEGALQQTKDVGHIFTKEEVEAAEAYLKSIEKAKTQMQGLADAIGSKVVPALGWAADKMTEFFKRVGKAGDDLGRVIDWVGGNTETAKPHMEALTASTAAYGATVATVTTKVKELSEVEKMRQTITKEFDALQKAVEDRQEAADKKRKDDKEAADKKRADEEKRRLEDQRAQETKARDALMDLWTDYHDAVTVESTDATQRQIDNIWRQANEQDAAMARAGTKTQETSDLIVAIAQAKAKKIADAGKVEIDVTKQIAAEQAALAREMADLFEPTRAIATEQARLDEVWVRATASARGLSTELVNQALAIEAVGRSSLDTSGKLSQMAAVLDAAHDQWNAMERTAADTGFHQETRFGQQYLVDKTGTISQPLERKYGAGGFLGYGLPQGVTMPNLQIQMHGLLLSNDPSARQQLSDVISRTVTDTLKGQGVRLGSGV